MTDRGLVALRAVVRGHVQGVNFRHFVVKRARALRLNGYVRNLEDGRSLEIVAEGARANLERLLEYLREGPRGAHVESVETHWGDASATYRDFGVSY